MKTKTNKRAKRNKFTPVIKYSSKGKTPKGDPFMRVKEARKYYQYASRGGIDSIAFILFDNSTKLFQLINESKPPLDERLQMKARLTTAFGGSIDMDVSPEEICLVEVEEETGYEVTLNRIYPMGETMVSTQMDQMCKLYLVDVTGLKKTKDAEFEKELTKEQASKDATEFIGNSVHWMTYSEVLENQDWKSIFIATRAIFKETIDNT